MPIFLKPAIFVVTDDNIQTTQTDYFTIAHAHGITI